MLPTANDRDRLEKLLALAESDRDGEAVAAVRAARDLLSRYGLRLVDVWHRASQSAGPAGTGSAGAGRATDDSLGWALDTAHEEVARLHGVVAGLEQRLAEAHAELAEARGRPTAAADPASAADLDRLLDGFRRLERRLSTDSRAGRRQADIRDAVLAYLEDPETSRLSNREIARRVGVSPQTVCNWRRKTAGALGMLPEDTMVTRNGKTYRMRTDRIGRRP